MAVDEKQAREQRREERRRRRDAPSEPSPEERRAQLRSQAKEWLDEVDACLAEVENP